MDEVNMENLTDFSGSRKKALFERIMTPTKTEPPTKRK
jgi:hypothetical protein